jgi:hypothetical protein
MEDILIPKILYKDVRIIIGYGGERKKDENTFTCK